MQTVQPIAYAAMVEWEEPEGWIRHRQRQQLNKSIWIAFRLALTSPLLLAAIYWIAAHPYLDFPWLFVSVVVAFFVLVPIACAAAEYLLPVGRYRRRHRVGADTIQVNIHSSTTVGKTYTWSDVLGYRVQQISPNVEWWELTLFLQRGKPITFPLPEDSATAATVLRELAVRIGPALIEDPPPVISRRSRWIIGVSTCVCCVAAAAVALAVPLPILSMAFVAGLLCLFGPGTVWLLATRSLSRIRDDRIFEVAFASNFFVFATYFLVSWFHTG